MVSPIAHAAAAVVVPSGQGLQQFGDLALAFLLSSLIGLEREWRQKSAGLRTHTLVGVGAALIMLISKYGFGDVVNGSSVVLDPSRIAAQIVSGLGFIGGGLIFVRRDAVRGLTTAAIVWVTAAVGMACGASLPLLAVFATAIHFVIVFGYRRLAQAMPRSRYVGFGLHIVYEDGRGTLRDVLTHCTEAGFSIGEVSTHRLEHEVNGVRAVAVDLEVYGQPRVDPLATALNDVGGVLEVAARDLADTE
ncbi:MAG TPA: MgtC/SapB family protein [Solirubrobacteraceae bacterium]|nr:MgtC/SapB family protein [Solirubrobacteraceae bacterium]